MFCSVPRSADFVGMRHFGDHALRKKDARGCGFISILNKKRVVNLSGVARSRRSGAGASRREHYGAAVSAFGLFGGRPLPFFYPSKSQRKEAGLLVAARSEIQKQDALHHRLSDRQKMFQKK